MILNRCPAKCHTCRAKVCQEQQEAAKIHTCRVGPIPRVADKDEEGPGDLEAFLGLGDWLFATVCSAPKATIAAMSNMGTELAEKALHSTPMKKADLIPHYLRDFEEVFAKESFDLLPEKHSWDHAIELEPGLKPSACKVYPLVPNEQVQLDTFLQENLSTGRIHPSKSLMASPVFFIKKKDGSLCLVQDYRALNAMTVKNCYPLPIISELINQLQGVKYFTKLDVRWGYNNVCIRKGDEWKAAFRTNRGLFEPLVMFFGLTNSPATFQTMMNEIFQDLIMEGHVCVYLDDILIFTETLVEHQRLLQIILEFLRHHKLYQHPEKCEFKKTKIEYLGLIVLQG